MKSVKIALWVSMFLLPFMLAAQNTFQVSAWEEELEQLSMGEGEERNWEDELEELSRRIQEPINLNAATKQQLELFPFLTPLQVENILAYIYIHGQMVSIEELQLVDEIDKRTIELLLPFVCVQPLEERKRYPSIKNILKYGKHQVLTRLDIPFYTLKGYEKDYLGTPQYHSLRYSFHYSDYLHVGVTAEKDAGEPMFALHNAKGYDSYSPYFIIKNLGRLKALALGNYRLSFGQGLVLNSNFRLGKTASLSTAQSRSDGIRKHSSTDEYNYFRGAAATVEIDPSLQLSAFYSHRAMDGVVVDGEITSIYKTGLHRTQKEADKQDAFTMQLMGGHVTYAKNSLEVGLTGLYYFFNHPYEPSLKGYARYNLHGSEFYNLGLDYKYRLGRFLWTGEAALGKQGYALLNQLHYNPSPNYRLLLLHRYYSHDYWALFARSFGEGSAPQNENGWYLAAEAAPLAYWRFFSSVDVFSSPWWKYRISKPSQGVDALLQATYSPRKDLSMYLSYRYKQKERDVSGTDGKDILPTFQHRLRYRLTYAPAPNLTLRTTLDYNQFHWQDKDANCGYQCTQLCSYTFTPFPLSASLQGNYFFADDYDTRVYASERGLLYTFNTPSYYGCGFHYSANLRYDFTTVSMLLVKLGQTIYQDCEELGSSNDLLAENKKTDLQMQFLLKF